MRETAQRPTQRLDQRGQEHASVSWFHLLADRRRVGPPGGHVPAHPAKHAGRGMSGHGRPGQEPSPPPLAWALLVIAAALVGGLAAAALVHTSLVIAVAVAVVLGAIAVAGFRSPAPERPATRPGRHRGRAAAPAGPAGGEQFAVGRPVVVGRGRRRAAAAELSRPAGPRAGPVHLPGLDLYRAMPAVRRVQARRPAGAERLGFPLCGPR